MMIMDDNICCICRRKFISKREKTVCVECLCDIRHHFKHNVSAWRKRGFTITYGGVSELNLSKIKGWSYGQLKGETIANSLLDFTGKRR